MLSGNFVTRPPFPHSIGLDFEEKITVSCKMWASSHQDGGSAPVTSSAHTSLASEFVIRNELVFRGEDAFCEVFVKLEPEILLALGTETSPHFRSSVGPDTTGSDTNMAAVRHTR